MKMLSSATKIGSLNFALRSVSLRISPTCTGYIVHYRIRNISATVIEDALQACSQHIIYTEYFKNKRDVSIQRHIYK